MKNLLKYLIIVAGIGLVDLVDSGVAFVQFYGPNSTTSSSHITLNQIPCKIKEGDMTYAFKTKGVVVYRCVTIENKKENEG